jgi:hypothetical protein
MLVMRIGTSRSCQLLTHAVQQTTCAVATRYSITSSAMASSDGDTSRPSALAVLRLMTNSNLVAYDGPVRRLSAKFITSLNAGPVHLVGRSGGARISLIARIEKSRTGPHPYATRAGASFRAPRRGRRGKGSTRRDGKIHRCGRCGQQSR